MSNSAKSKLVKSATWYGRGVGAGSGVSRGASGEEAFDWGREMDDIGMEEQSDDKGDESTEKVSVRTIRDPDGNVYSVLDGQKRAAE